MAGISGALERGGGGEEPSEAERKSLRAGKEKQQELDHKLWLAAMQGDRLGVEGLLSAGASARAKKSKALLAAASNGHVECLALLCSKKHEKGQLAMALKVSAMCGRVACVLELFERVENSEEKLAAIRMAAGWGRAEVVSVLLGRGVGRDQSALIELMERAGEEGHEGTVEVIASFIEGWELSKSVQPAGAASAKSGLRL